jgi:hypothetical protein
MLKTIYAMLTKQEAIRPMVKGSTGQRPGVMVGSPHTVSQIRSA